MDLILLPTNVVYKVKKSEVVRAATFFNFINPKSADSLRFGNLSADKNELLNLFS